MPNDALLSAAEAAEILGIGRRAVLELVRTKELPAQKLPGRTGAYILDRADVERLRAERQAQASA